MVIKMKEEVLQFVSLMENEREEITILSNASAFLSMILADVSWTGFYLFQNDELILGPFQGKIACTHIPVGKGVCGTCAQKKETLIVPNVHEFEGHIACDSASNSEIVVPILIDDTLYGVLDIDSTRFDRFQKNDQLLLEECMKQLAQHLKSCRNV